MQNCQGHVEAIVELLKPQMSLGPRRDNNLASMCVLQV